MCFKNVDWYVCVVGNFELREIVGEDDYVWFAGDKVLWGFDIFLYVFDVCYIRLCLVFFFGIGCYLYFSDCII